MKNTLCYILAVCSLFAQDCCPKTCCPPPIERPACPGYNVTSRVEVDGCWDLFTRGSFLYWNASQSNMELGVVATLDNPAYFINGNLSKLDFGYEPGFQMGLGMNFNKDSWDSLLQYTWFRSNVSSRVSLDPQGDKILYPSWQIPDLLVAYFNGNENWTLSLDLLDFELGRKYAVGQDLSFRTFVSLRAAFIHQKVEVNYENVTNSIFLPRNHVFVKQTARSWALGPRTGLETSWDLGLGFNFFSNGSLDLLFTEYTKLKAFQEGTTTGGTVLPGSLASVTETDDQHIRTHMDLDFGFGYGTYFYCNRWHVDLLLGYQFQIFFDQNMFRSFVDDQTLGKADSPHGNLYIHGLTATLRLDF